MSHGQASVERGFSLRNSTLKDNISDISTYSKRVIIDHMMSKKIKASTMEISTPMMVSYKSARTKYEEAKQKDALAKKVTKEESQGNCLTLSGPQGFNWSKSCHFSKYYYLWDAKQFVVVPMSIRLLVSKKFLGTPMSLSSLKVNCTHF